MGRGGRRLRDRRRRVQGQLRRAQWRWAVAVPVDLLVRGCPPATGHGDPGRVAGLLGRKLAAPRLEEAQLHLLHPPRSGGGGPWRAWWSEAHTAVSRSPLRLAPVKRQPRHRAPLTRWLPRPGDVRSLRRVLVRPGGKILRGASPAERLEPAAPRTVMNAGSKQNGGAGSAVRARRAGLMSVIGWRNSMAPRSPSTANLPQRFVGAARHDAGSGVGRAFRWRRVVPGRRGTRQGSRTPTASFIRWSIAGTDGGGSRLRGKRSWPLT